MFCIPNSGCWWMWNVFLPSLQIIFNSVFILRPSSGDEVMQMWREYIFIQDFQAEKASFLESRAVKDLS